mmetsp:Transcript_235/g.239  ORF Transcript_235/g.239 Transcript_235/m.239 type:complete len:208 (-) Transcript_235:723-1346(-)
MININLVHPKEPSQPQQNQFMGKESYVDQFLDENKQFLKEGSDSEEASDSGEESEEDDSSSCSSAKQSSKRSSKQSSSSLQSSESSYKVSQKVQKEINQYRDPEEQKEKPRVFEYLQNREFEEKELSDRYFGGHESNYEDSRLSMGHSSLADEFLASSNNEYKKKQEEMNEEYRRSFVDRDDLSSSSPSSLSYFRQDPNYQSKVQET